MSLLEGHVPPTVEWLPEEPHWKAVTSASVRDLALATTAKRHGANYSLRIIWEARRANAPISLLFAMCEKESNFQNVYGHDNTIFVGAGKVTKNNYRLYKLARQTPGKHMQGVNVPQLTWWEFQDRADKLGGCWVERNAIRVAAEVLGAYYNKYKRQGKSTREAIVLAGRDYNGRLSYGEDLYVHYKKWHSILT
jgi:hypothetical protein